MGKVFFFPTQMILCIIIVPILQIYKIAMEHFSPNSPNNILLVPHIMRVDHRDIIFCEV